MGRPKKIATAMKTVADLMPGLSNLCDAARIKLTCICDGLECICRLEPVKPDDSKEPAKPPS